MDNLYPINWNKCVSEYIQKSFTNYSNIYREFQPFIVLTNSVYKTVEKYTLENFLTVERPIKNFLDTSYKNILLRKSIPKKSRDIKYMIKSYAQRGLSNKYFCWEN